MDIYKKPVILDDYLNVNGPQLDEDKLLLFHYLMMNYIKIENMNGLNLDEKQFEESEFFIKNFYND